MNAFERAIHSYCGLVIEGIPADGKMRKFKIGNQEGYAIYFGDCGSFGNWDRNEMFGFDGRKAFNIEAYVPPVVYRGRALQEEQKIVDMYNKRTDSGGLLSDSENDRYILALCRVIEAKKHADPV